ncbi:MAG: YqeG family HAD IIIA-type phosphatase [Bacillaceae bacterium]|nr:YqeG family HAD IIIA-type phosphatase [Bacillaceae bacterium]
MLLKRFLPDLHVKSIYDIDFTLLKQRGVKGIITDLDNTLIEWDRPDATEELVEWVEEAKRNGFQVVIVSNNTSSDRVSRFSASLQVPFISRAKKPTRKPFLKAVEMMGLDTREVVVVGDQILTDVLGGNRTGIYTILVVPVASTDGFFTRINRMVERRVLRIMRKKGMLNWEDES